MWLNPSIPAYPLGFRLPWLARNVYLCPSDIAHTIAWIRTPLSMLHVIRVFLQEGPESGMVTEGSQMGSISRICTVYHDGAGRISSRRSMAASCSPKCAKTRARRAQAPEPSRMKADRQSDS